jgi:predicted transcriptional regulator of viral defense system
MNYWDFRNTFIELGAFSVCQAEAMFPDLDRNTLTRWQRKGLLIKLRNGFYALTEAVSQPNFVLYLSNFIYKPSYVSLHTALAFYGMASAAEAKITAVSSLKTAVFENDIFQFSYQTIKPELMFGYEQKPLGNRIILMATPEKALLDLLYLYPYLNTPQEIKNLRIDEDFVRNDLNVKTLTSYLKKSHHKELAKRVKIFTDVHRIRFHE